jgi:hypothetical protein
MAAHMRCEAELAAVLSDQDQSALAAMLRKLLIGMENGATKEKAQ